MCGIIGAVGKSTDPYLSFQLLTNLMIASQARGKHATGYYVIDETNVEHWFKSPIPASMFVTASEWKNVAALNLKVMIGHTRYKTRGSEFLSDNNHPHVSLSGNVALVHNGNLYTSEKYRKEYNLKGDTDSEMILKIILETNNITNGIKNVFKKFGSSGDFSCELIYRNPKSGEASFYFFRDSGRPGKIIDLKDQLGQYFFCSTSRIWSKAYEMLTDKQKEKLKFVVAKTIPSFQIWKIPSETLEIKKISLEVPSKRKKKPDFNTFQIVYPVSQIVYGKNHTKIYKYVEDQEEHDKKTAAEAQKNESTNILSNALAGVIKTETQ